jgi:uncharacterized protein with PIN domain
VATAAKSPGGEVKLPRIFADTMLGRLARALRLVGLDTTYADEEGRARALDSAILTGRVIATRDKRLNSYGCRRVFVVSDHWEEQLAQVLVELGLDRAALPAFSRCSRCNREIVPVARDEVRDVVPPFVFATQRAFHRCPGCARVYWAGTHVQRMQSRLGVEPR